MFGAGENQLMDKFSGGLSPLSTNSSHSHLSNVSIHPPGTSSILYGNKLRVANEPLSFDNLLTVPNIGRGNSPRYLSPSPSGSRSDWTGTPSPHEEVNIPAFEDSKEHFPSSIFNVGSAQSFSLYSVPPQNEISPSYLVPSLSTQGFPTFKCSSTYDASQLPDWKDNQTLFI